MRKKRYITIDPTRVEVGGITIDTEGKGEEMLNNLYRERVGDYPKFFKMDVLSKLGFIASEILLELESIEDDKPRFVPDEERGVIMGNLSASIANDREYEKTIEKDNYFPSPALFVYTLPNIVTGEIAIRNKYYGESGFYVVEDIEALKMIVIASGLKSAIVGWVECRGKDDFHAEVEIV